MSNYILGRPKVFSKVSSMISNDSKYEDFDEHHHEHAEHLVRR